MTHLQQHAPAVATVTIGRDPGNQIVVPDPLVSRQHARVEIHQGVAWVRDLGSFRGTFVDGRRVKDAAPLPPGSRLTVGNHAMVWDGRWFAPAPPPSGPALVARDLAVRVRGKTLMEGVSLSFDAGSLTAVIGPSGAGKSTLLGALTGLRPASTGRVWWQGQDLYADYDQLRFQVGLVPQQDIQHHQLKVRQALGFAAELRLPPDTSPAERRARVDDVAAQLQLTERMGNRIGTQLSGGQKKRVSIATELLTAPPLLFLDEPTSGLDPGLDVEIMRQLRGLADTGRTVVVVTHSVLALDTCDTVVVMAPGGRLAYVGPPAGVLRHFGAASYPEVFGMLEHPDLWARIAPQAPPAPPAPQQPTQPMAPPPNQHPGQQPGQPPAHHLTPAPAYAVPGPSLGPSPTPAPAVGGGRAAVRPTGEVVRSQLLTLIRRNVAVVGADRLLTGMLVALPLVMGLLSRIVPGSAGMSLLNAPLAPGGLLNSSEASKRLILLIVSAALIGVAMTIRELVGERPIFRREYAVGLFPDLYLASKVAVLGVVTFGQGLVVTAIATVGLPGPDDGGSLGLGRAELAVTIGALAFTMAMVGLLLSAVLTSTEQTMPALVGMVMVQLVLSGALFDVAGRFGLEQLSWLAPARWAYAAAAGTVAIQRPTVQQGLDRDWIAIHGGVHWVMDMVMLGLLCVGTILLAVVAVRRSAVTR